MVKISLKFYIIVIEYQHKTIDQQQSYYYDKITKKERYEK